MADFVMDDNFEPQARSRSNTWPVRPREAQIHIENVTSPDTLQNDDGSSPILEDSAVSSTKRGGSRKNAWGNFSYADLISKAIESSPEKRLTLAQIYDWLVQNVPYFKDKGDCNSSAGWKNSIRHNLSLHSRFIRVQNEGTGKSSWWMINPDAKGTKSSRRRTTSMDPHGDLIKKRNKAKSRVEELQRASGVVPMLYRSESEAEFPTSGSEMNLIDPFAYGQQEFRMRSGSNASSYGRLSPLHSLLEPTLQSSSGWSSQQGLNGGEVPAGITGGSDNLADLWDAMTLSTDADSIYANTNTLNASEQLSLSMFSPDAGNYIRAPPSYEDSGMEMKPQVIMQHSPHSRQGGSNMLGIQSNGGVSPQRIGSGIHLNQQQNSYSPLSTPGINSGLNVPLQGSLNLPMQGSSPNRNIILTQQQLEAQSLINELLADGIKNEASMRYQYGTNGVNVTSDVQQVAQAQVQFGSYSDQPIGDFKPIKSVVSNNAANVVSDSFGSQLVDNKMITADFFSQNNNGTSKSMRNPTLVTSSFPSLVSTPFGNQNTIGMVIPSIPVTINGSSNTLSNYGMTSFQQSQKLQNHALKDEILVSLMQRQRQQHMSGGGLQLSAGLGNFMPGDIDVSLQELRAGGLLCDMEQILLEGNLDLTVD